MDKKINICKLGSLCNSVDGTLLNILGTLVEKEWVNIGLVDTITLKVKDQTGQFVIQSVTDGSKLDMLFEKGDILLFTKVLLQTNKNTKIGTLCKKSFVIKFRNPPLPYDDECECAFFI